jgi:cysteine desulfurase
MSGRVYLDYNATAPVRPEARAAALDALQAGNPSSVHYEGRHARALMDKARRDIAGFIGGAHEGLIFTSGGTEACNMAAKLSAAPAGVVQRLVVSAIEHVAVSKAAAAQGLPVQTLPVTPHGLIDVPALATVLQDPTPALVCVMLANNETGVVQPIEEISAMVRANGSLLFVDAVQAAGKMPIDVAALGCDALALSGHKLGAPMGTGALWARDGLVTPPHMQGGGQELGRRAGSENMVGILAFAAAAKASGDTLTDFAAMAAWRDDMEAQLRAAFPELEVFGAEAPRLANTSSFSLAGLSSEMLVMALDLAGISVSAGSACSSGKVSRSHVLDAMGVSDDLSKGVVRVSFGWASRASDAETLVETWSRLAAKQKSSEKIVAE